jgi:chemotaxis protein methyltransferase CheR
MTNAVHLGLAHPAPPGPRDIARIAAIAEAEAGLVIGPTRTGLVQSRLNRRLVKLGFTDFASYLDHVTSDAGVAERKEMISALTTNVSHFFRERHHFVTLASEVLPGLIARARKGGRVRIWSAGCSEGQEPFSIALTVLDSMPDAADFDVRILATDIDRGVLSKARQATFPRSALSEVPERQIAAHFLDRGEQVEAATHLRQLIRFEELNLHGDWPMTGSFDVIFCRNVMIYFSPERQNRLCQRFAGILAQQGWLFIGHSERVGAGLNLSLVPAGDTTYRRGV